MAPCADVADIRTHLDVADIRTRLKGADIPPPYPDTQTMPPYKIRDEAPPVVQKTYTFTLWLVRKVENFPRSHRFTVGDRLTAHALDLMALLTEAAYSRRKEPLLESASHKLNSLRFLLRLAKDLDLLAVDSYGFCAQNLEEIGRMVGGWRKSAIVGAPAQS